MMVSRGRALRCALMLRSSPARQNLIIYMNADPIIHVRHLTACYWKGMHSNGPFAASCDDVCSHKHHARYHHNSGLSCRYNNFTALWYILAKGAVSKRGTPATARSRARCRAG